MVHIRGQCTTANSASTSAYNDVTRGNVVTESTTNTTVDGSTNSGNTTHSTDSFVGKVRRDACRASSSRYSHTRAYARADTHKPKQTHAYAAIWQHEFNVRKKITSRGEKTFQRSLHKARAMYRHRGFTAWSEKAISNGGGSGISTKSHTNAFSNVSSRATILTLSRMRRPRCYTEPQNRYKYLPCPKTSQHPY